MSIGIKINYKKKTYTEEEAEFWYHVVGRKVEEQAGKRWWSYAGIQLSVQSVQSVQGISKSPYIHFENFSKNPGHLGHLGHTAFSDNVIEASLEVLRSITWDGWKVSRDELMSAVRHVSNIRQVSEGDLLAVLMEAGLTLEGATITAPEDVLARIVKLRKHGGGGDI